MTVSQLNTQHEFNSNYGTRIKAKEASIFFLHSFAFASTSSILIAIDYFDDVKIQWAHWAILFWSIILVSHFYMSFLSPKFESFVYARIKR
jgi:2TM domain